MGPIVAKYVSEFGRFVDGLGLAWLAWLALPWLGLACLSAWLVIVVIVNSKNNNPPAFGGRAALRAAVVFAVAKAKPSQAKAKPGQAKPRQAKQGYYTFAHDFVHLRGVTSEPQNPPKNPSWVDVGLFSN